MVNKIKLYRNPKSGHCHRVELMLALLNLPYQTIDLDMENAEHKKAAYLKISPFGLVPAIDDEGFTLSDSNAILIYLVQKYAPNSQWLPCDAKSAANVQRWLSIAADNIYSGPCAARLVTLFGAPLDHAGAVKKSHDLLIMMEAYLENRQWLVQTHITIADVAAYSYIAHAPEGGVSLKAYPNIRAWIGRIEQLPNFVPMIPSAHVELS